MNPTSFFRLGKPLGRVKNSLEPEGHQSLLAAVLYFSSVLTCSLCCSAFPQTNAKSGEGKGGLCHKFSEWLWPNSFVSAWLFPCL